MEVSGVSRGCGVFPCTRGTMLTSFNLTLHGDRINDRRKCAEAGKLYMAAAVRRHHVLPHKCHRICMLKTFDIAGVIG